MIGDDLGQWSAGPDGFGSEWHEGGEKIVDTLGVEVRLEDGERLCGWETEQDNRKVDCIFRDTRGRAWGESGEVAAVGRKDEAMHRVRCYFATLLSRRVRGWVGRGIRRGTMRVHGQHVSGTSGGDLFVQRNVDLPREMSFGRLGVHVCNGRHHSAKRKMSE